ncbi:MAG: ABC transporter permease [Chlorobiota bacterium]|nr:ABC transporter permease [Chlorobiota bacterium]QQS67557.1 MAG: ABC transporter permease [Chlorobiota bacterium]
MKKFLNIIGLFGEYVKFTIRFFATLFKPPLELGQILKHLDDLGSKSMQLALTANFILGFILALQSRPTMQKFGAGELVASMVTRSFTRELGPVITALMVAGRVASGIGAELGSMKVTEQIEAMECSGVDPFNYLVKTRIIALIILMPILTTLSDFVAIYGGYVAELINTRVSLRYYYSQVLSSLYFEDALPGIFKTVFFGMAIGIIGCYKGFNTKGGTEGVGKTTTSAVVVSSLWIILLDMILVQLTVTFIAVP